MWKRILFFAALHFMTILGLVMVAAVAMGDDSGAEPQGIELIATSLVEVLWQPMFWLAETLNASGNNAIEWALVGGTSLLWGAALAALTSWRRKPQNKRHES